MAPVARKALSISSNSQRSGSLKPTAALNENKLGMHVRASCEPSLISEMGKWSWGNSTAIDKVAKLELHSKETYINDNHDKYDRLWDYYQRIHDPKAIGKHDRRRDGVSLGKTSMLFKDVQTSMQAGQHKYDLEYPSKGLNPLDSNRRALRFILVKRWRVLLELVRQLLPEGYDPDACQPFLVLFNCDLPATRRFY